MNLQSIIQAIASVANVLSVIVLGVGYYFMVRLYREWLRQREETRTVGGRPLVIVAADYDHLPEVNLVVRNFTQAPAKDVSFEFSAPVKGAQRRVGKKEPPPTGGGYADPTCSAVMWGAVPAPEQPHESPVLYR